ncbi:MAG TPA: hypothetical protein VNE63_06850 [Candidatus Acidoferrales bacterium]|nr:hypothetical protein [Candidatus Acidoferrales bacterium]
MFSVILFMGLTTLLHAQEQQQASQPSFANSGTAAAQKPFLHGLAQLHNFEYETAADDFPQAQAISPNFSLCTLSLTIIMRYEVLTFIINGEIVCASPVRG